MRQLKTILITALLATLMISCATTVPEKLDSFVDKTEKAGPDYSPEDWTDANSEYMSLIEEFIQNKDSYTDEEVKVALNAMGRYHAVLIKNGLTNAATFVKEITDKLPSYIDGMADGFENEISSLRSLIESIDVGKIEKSFENLGSAIEEFISNIDKNAE